MAPPGPAQRVFCASIANSGMSGEEVAGLVMTEENRNLPRSLPIYSKPGLFQVLAKVECTCPHSEVQTALNLITSVLVGLLREGRSVEDSVAKVVSLYPGHVRHGVLYQLKANPEKRTIPRFNRQNLLVSESDDVFARKKARQHAASASVSKYGSMSMK